MNQPPGMQPQQGARPGQMTAVMRAMSMATGPKVLRIGLVHGGRVIEERIIKQRTSVTIGQSEKAMFVIPAQSVPPQFKLFELAGNEYYLNFIDGMTGRVALATGISDITALKGQAKRVGNAYQIKLTEEARGKVIVGETTFLFQFVAPPPLQPRPQLPLAVKGGLASQIDWTLAIIAAFSFMLHFGVIGAMYSDWMDPIVNEDLAISGLIDLAKNVPPPVIEDDTPKPADTGPTTNDKPSPTASKPVGGQPQGGGPKGGAVSDSKAAALAQQADAMQMQMLAAFGGNSAVQGALNRSDIPPVDLSGAAASGAGVSTTGGGLSLGSGGVPVQARGGSGLAGIGGTTAAQAGTGAGTVRDVGGPKGDAQIGGATTTVPVNNAERVVAGLRAKFRSCYNQGLQSDPTMQGAVTISAKIAPNGEVSSADIASNSGLSDSVAKCIARAVRNANFDAPGGTGSSINIPVKFVQQK
jgi:hypothetical protein